MTISAQIITDSISPDGKRITTFLLKYPRFIHAEVMTHRMLSRNASSSRAQPFKKLLKSIRQDMAAPIQFTENKPGMQGGEPLSPTRQFLAKGIWHLTGHMVLFMSRALAATGAAKQFVNRMAEPWSHITVVATATEWANFYALRYHPAAQPEIYELAKCMWEAQSNSKPQAISFGQMHLPFVTAQEQKDLPLADQIKVSVARCARTSYNNFDGKVSQVSDDLKLYDKLVGGNPKHASPAEHQARPSTGRLSSGNFIGWTQLRKEIPEENIYDFAPPK